jgi:voltage-gated potassium channel
LLEGWNWGDALYMTVITISTVGFSETHPLSPSGRALTVGLIFVGAGTVAFTLSALLELGFQRQVRFFLEKRGMQHAIGKLRNHVVLCGYGRMGRLVSEELVRTGAALVVVEHNDEIIHDLETRGLLYVDGNATEEEVLTRAGSDCASALVAAPGTDADSPFVDRTLAEARVRQVTGCMIVAIQRPGAKTIFDPQPDTRLHAGDVPMALGSCPTLPVAYSGT